MAPTTGFGGENLHVYEDGSEWVANRK